MDDALRLLTAELNSILDSRTLDDPSTKESVLRRVRAQLEQKGFAWTGEIDASLRKHIEVTVPPLPCNPA